MTTSTLTLQKLIPHFFSISSRVRVSSKPDPTYKTLFASVHRARLFPHFFLVHSFSSSFSFYFFLFFTHPLIPKQHRACLFPHETSFLVVCDFKRCDFGNLTKPPKLKKKKMRFGISKWHFAIWKSYLHFEIAKCFFPVLTLTTHSNNRLFILFG